VRANTCLYRAQLLLAHSIRQLKSQCLADWTKKLILSRPLSQVYFLSNKLKLSYNVENV